MKKIILFSLVAFQFLTTQVRADFLPKDDSRTLFCHARMTLQSVIAKMTEESWRVRGSDASKSLSNFRPGLFCFVVRPVADKLQSSMSRLVERQDLPEGIREIPKAALDAKDLISNVCVSGAEEEADLIKAHLAILGVETSLKTEAAEFCKPKLNQEQAQ